MVKVYLVPKRLCAQMGRQLALKQEAQGPFIAHLITNSKQFSQQKDNQNDRIQINAYACVVGNSLKEDFVKGEALPTKFHQNPSSGSGEEVKNVKSLRTMTCNLHRQQRTDGALRQ